MIPTFNDKPVFVLDLNIIQSLSVDSSVLPTNFHYILPDTAVREVATTKLERRVPQLLKLYDFLSLNKEVLFLSKYWQDISQSESFPGYGSNPESVIEWNLTRSLRNDVFASKNEYLKNAEQLDADVSEHQIDKDQFVKLLTTLAEQRKSNEHFTGRLAQEMRDNIQHRILYIQQPKAISHWFNKHPNQKYHDPDWMKSLEVFPDIHAMGRWLRIMTWYEMMRTIDYKTKDFSNNYEDAQYAFTASYFQGLVTNDNGLKECVESIFPQITVFTSIDELNAYTPHKVPA